MTLETLLREAAPEARFTPDDVRTRVDRTRRRRRISAGLAVVALLAAGVVGASALTGDDERSRIIAGPPNQAAAAPLTLTADDLAGARWLADETVGPTTAWLDFDVRGRWSAATECQRISGDWEVRSDGLRLVETGTSRDIGCTTRFALAGVGRMVGGDTLRFTARHGIVDFHRADRIATLATMDDLTGTWRTADGEQTWRFAPGELTVNGCRLGAWQVQDGDLQVQVPAPTCDRLRPDRQAADQAGFWLGDGSAEPHLVDDELYLVTSATTVRLTRVEPPEPDAVAALRGYWLAEGTDGRLLSDFHVEVFLGDADDPEVVGLPTGPSLRIFNGCEWQFASWTLVGSTVALEPVSTPIPYCAPSDQAPFFPGYGGEDFTVVDDDLVAGPTQYRHLSALDAPNGGVLEGRWSGPNGSFDFQPDGRLQTSRCVDAGWELTNHRLVITDCPDAEGIYETSIGDDGTLYLARPGTVWAVNRVVDDLPPDRPAERMLLDAYEAMGVDRCCQEPPEGRDWGLAGFVWEGEDVPVVAAPVDEAPTPSTDDHAATCRGYLVIVSGPADAAAALFEVLGCSSG